MADIINSVVGNAVSVGNQRITDVTTLFQYRTACPPDAAFNFDSFTDSHVRLDIPYHGSRWDYWINNRYMFRFQANSEFKDFSLAQIRAVDSNSPAIIRFSVGDGPSPSSLDDADLVAEYSVSWADAASFDVHLFTDNSIQFFKPDYGTTRVEVNGELVEDVADSSNIYSISLDTIQSKDTTSSATVTLTFDGISANFEVFWLDPLAQADGYTVSVEASYVTPPPSIPGDKWDQFGEEGTPISNTLLRSFYGNTQFQINTSFTMIDPNGYANPQILGSDLIDVQAFDPDGNNLDAGEFVNDGSDTITSGGSICISVIDESDTFTADVIRDDWLRFRAANPTVPFYLLQPGGPDYGEAALRIPDEFKSDPNAYGRILVNRPHSNRNTAAAYDWFTLCNLDQERAGTTVYLSIDNSGSMTIAQVQAAKDILAEKLAAAGMNLVEYNMGGRERWAELVTDVLAQYTNASADLVQVYSPFPESWDTIYDAPLDENGSPALKIRNIDTSSSEFDLIILDTALGIPVEQGDTLVLGDAIATVRSFTGGDNFSIEVEKLPEPFILELLDENSPIVLKIKNIDTSDPSFDLIILETALGISIEQGDTLTLGDEIGTVRSFTGGDSFSIEVEKLPQTFINEPTSLLEVDTPYPKAIYQINRNLSNAEFNSDPDRTYLQRYNAPDISEVRAVYTYSIQYTSNLISEQLSKTVPVTQYLYWDWRQTLADGATFDQAIATDDPDASQGVT